MVVVVTVVCHLKTASRTIEAGNLSVTLILQTQPQQCVHWLACQTCGPSKNDFIPATSHMKMAMTTVINTAWLTQRIFDITL